MAAGRLLEEEIDAELLLSKLQGRGTASEHLNLSYLGLTDHVLARVAAVMRQSSAFANLKQIWLGSNQLSCIGDMQLPSCLTGIWLFSNRLNSHSALDLLQRLCRSCLEIQFVHMVCACAAPMPPCRFTASSRKTMLFALRTWLCCLRAEVTPTCPRSWCRHVVATAWGSPATTYNSCFSCVKFSSLFLHPHRLVLNLNPFACLSCAIRKPSVSIESCPKHRALVPSSTAATSYPHSAAPSFFQKFRLVLPPCQPRLHVAPVTLPVPSGSLRVINLSCNGLTSGEISTLSPAFQRMTVCLRARSQHLPQSSRCRLCTPLT
jgi:hypothetical protein